MKKHASRMVLVIALLGAMGSWQATSFGFPPRAKAAKARGRVPPNFAKLDLSEDQKTKIYDVQAKYKEQIDALNLQLKDLRAKEMQEVSEILTPEQKTKLQEMEDAAKKEKAEKAAAKKKDKAEAKETKKVDEKPAEKK